MVLTAAACSIYLPSTKCSNKLKKTNRRVLRSPNCWKSHNLVGFWNLERLNDTVWTMFLPTCTLTSHLCIIGTATVLCARVCVLNSGLWAKMAKLSKLLNRKMGQDLASSRSCLFARYWICWMQDKWQAPPLPDLFHSSILLLSELTLVPEKWLMFIQNVTLPKGCLWGTSGGSLIKMKHSLFAAHGSNSFGSYTPVI